MRKLYKIELNYIISKLLKYEVVIYQIMKNDLGGLYITYQKVILKGISIGNICKFHWLQVKLWDYLMKIEVTILDLL